MFPSNTRSILSLPVGEEGERSDPWRLTRVLSAVRIRQHFTEPSTLTCEQKQAAATVRRSDWKRSASLRQRGRRRIRNIKL